jgi:hypothetical protein
MTRLVESLERRDQPRVRRELPCALLVEGRRHRGFVQDISAWGLFVQTPGELPPGADAIVDFRTPEGRRFVLEASVPHRRQVSLSLASLGARGVGLHIQDPPAAYLRWVEGLSTDE